MKKVTTVGTLIEYKDKILILLRGGKEENAPGTWGLAAGRHETENKEQERENSIKESACREILEETGYQADVNELIPAGIYEWPQPTMHVTFHAFQLPISKQFEVKLDPDEHIDFKWATKEEILALENPIAGLKELIKTVYNKQNRENS